MKVAVSGATGFVGSALVRFLRARGHEVSRLVRSPKDVSPGDIPWDPAAGKLDATALDGVDAIVNLSGENLATRWSPERKKQLIESRLQPTTLIATTIAAMARRPSVFVSTSAIGIYGADRGDEELDEKSSHGADFLAQLCQQWEGATKAAADAGIRVVNPRFGIIMNPEGGVLEKLLLPFKMGAGGKVGSGEQWVSWIARDDLLSAILFLIEQSVLSGPVNVTAPNPVTNESLAKDLGKVLHRPAVAPVPATVVRLMFGREMADGTVLASQRVFPRRLTAAGFTFQFPTLEEALLHELAAH